MTDPSTLPAELRARAADIRLAAFDVDGTLTDGRLWYSGDGHELKAFHAHDGQGLKFLMAAGIEVAIITARQSRPVTLRVEDLGIRHMYQGQPDKAHCLSGLQTSLGISREQTLFVGDDVPDIAAMQVSGLGVAVANAHASVKAQADWCTRLRGGEGAVREVCDLLLACRAEAGAEPSA